MSRWRNGVDIIHGPENKTLKVKASKQLEQTSLVWYNWSTSFGLSPMSPAQKGMVAGKSRTRICTSMSVSRNCSHITIIFEIREDCKNRIPDTVEFWYYYFVSSYILLQFEFIITTAFDRCGCRAANHANFPWEAHEIKAKICDPCCCALKEGAWWIEVHF
jgi:hypothetical protein